MASQVNHFKEFATQAEYDAYIFPDDYPKPLVALVDETDTVMFPQGGGGGDCGNPILTSIDVDDYSGGTTFNGLAQITEVEFPAGITTIDVASFTDCKGLTSVSIPSGVTSIGQSAFANCYGLTSVSIPSGVTSIGNSAFNACSSLTSIVFPSTLTSIGNSAFRNCGRLASVTVNATTPPTSGTYVFNSTSANLVIYVPAESVETYKAANNWSTYASRIQAIPATP